jgi:hypothetical protein
MGWIIQLIVVVVLLQVAPIWLPVIVALLMIWHNTMRRQRGMERRTQRAQRTAVSAGLSTELLQIALLRQWLRQALRNGLVDPDEQGRMVGCLDALEERCCSALMLPESDRRQALEAAWKLLEAQADIPLMMPPWRMPATVETGGTTRPETPPEPRAVARAANPKRPVSSDPIPAPTPPPTPPPSISPISNADLEPTHQPAAPPQQRSQSAISQRQLNPTSAAKPKQPGRLSRMNRRSRALLSHFLLPFLLQNIGWFIGGFCFVSGSVFLVAYTSGFAKALVVVGTLTLYGLLLFWGGYRIRRKRPELVTAAQVLTALGMLLIPLVFAAATRLMITGLGETWQLITALAVSGAVTGLFTVAAQVGSGMMDRTLLGQHAWLFILLAAVQFATPLLIVLPLWPLLALLHIGLLGLLIFAIRRFGRGWLHRLFIDRRRLALYAAGTLLYAAVVSFIHTTWSSGVILPAGYSGPFLMALAGMLLYIDLNIKKWVEKRAWLGHFNFLIYALSAVALLVGLIPCQSFDAAFWPLVLMLVISSVLYATMLWHYLSLPPLYLLFGSLSALYAIVVLLPFPDTAHFFVSLPGLYGLLMMRRLALRRQAPALARALQRLLFFLIAAIALWVLVHADPGWTAMITPLTALLAFLVVLGIMPKRLAPGHHKPVTIDGSGYLLTLFTALTFAYAPRLAVIPWPLQFGIALLGLASVWTLLAGSQLRRPRPAWNPEILVNSALLSLIAAIGFAFMGGMGPFVGVLAASGALLLWLSLILRSQLLLYSAMLIWAADAFLLIDYYRMTTSGSSSLLVAVGIYGLLQWLEWRSRRTGSAAGDAGSLRVLWCWPLRAGTYPSRTVMVMQPLDIAFSLLWLFGLSKVMMGLAASFSIQPELGIRLAPAAGWTTAASLAALGTVLQSGRTRSLIWLLPLPMFLMLCVILAVVPVPHAWQPVMIAAYAMLAWVLSVQSWVVPPALLNLLGWQGGYGAAGGRRLTERILHWSAFSLLLGGLALALTGSNEPLLATLAIGVAFLWLAGRRYRLQLYSYLVVAGVSLGTFVLYRHLLNAEILPSPALHELALILILVAAGLSAWAFRLSAAARLRTTAAPEAAALYIQPLCHLAYLTYALALFMAVPSTLQALVSAVLPVMKVNAAGQAGLLFLLAFALLPLLRPCSAPAAAQLSGFAAAIRGVAMPLLLSLAFLLLVPDARRFGVIAWSFALWAAGSSILPRWNAWTRRPETPRSWRMPVDGAFSTALGLVLILGGLTLHTLQIHPDPAAATLAGALPPLLACTLAPLIGALFALQQLSMPLLLGLTLYLILLLREPVGWGDERTPTGRRWTRPPLSWAAAIAVTFCGLAGLLHLFALSGGISKAFVLGALLWLNLLLRFGLLWRSAIPAGFRRLLPLTRLSAPLRTMATGLLLSFLLAVSVPTLFMLVHAIATGAAVHAPGLLTIGLSMLLTGSFAHRFRLKPSRAFAHLLLFSLCTTTLLFLLTWVDIALMLALWATVLLSIPALLERGLVSPKWRLLGAASQAWLGGSFAVAILIWCVRDTQSIMERLLTLALLIGVALAIGLRAMGDGHSDRGRMWLKGGVLLSLLWLHWIGFAWLPAGVPVAVLLPWYALGMGGLAWLAYQFASGPNQRPSFREKQLSAAGLSGALIWLLTWAAPWLFLLAMGEWLLYSWHYHQSLSRSVLMQALAGTLDHWAAIAAGILFVGLWLRQRRLGEDGRIVAMALTAAVLGIDIRLLLAGVAPLSVWDTTALLAAGFGLAVFQHLWRRTGPVPAALDYLTLLMPALALLTVPMQLNSERASVSLLAVAALYLFMRRNRSDRLPVWLALLAFNLSIYLWVPGLAVTTDLVQLYTIPAAVTVLLMLQLHLLELKPSVANAVRSIALSALYASATLDLFLRPELTTFILALALSLVGVLLGIVLRLRAFLYTGTVFMVLNITGQLVNYYPQQTLGKAIVLMVLGGLITGGMIWFNIQREAILERVRIIRADLAEWA